VRRLARARTHSQAVRHANCTRLFTQTACVRRTSQSLQAPVVRRADPRHPESDTKVRRGRNTKQGDRLVRWNTSWPAALCEVLTVFHHLHSAADHAARPSYADTHQNRQPLNFLNAVRAEPTYSYPSHALIARIGAFVSLLAVYAAVIPRSAAARSDNDLISLVMPRPRYSRNASVPAEIALPLAKSASSAVVAAGLPSTNAMRLTSLSNEFQCVLYQSS